MRWRRARSHRAMVRQREGRRDVLFSFCFLFCMSALISNLRPLVCRPVSKPDNLLRRPTRGGSTRRISAARAQEHARPDRMFEDRFASALAGREGFDFRGGSAPIATSRTRFFDDAALNATLGGVTQVVSMAAGMCTRAVRLPFPPGVTLWELDKQVIFDIKEPILESMLTPQERDLCNRVVVPVDFENPPPKHRADPSGHWAELLVDAGFDPAQPSMWMMEGLTYYLPPEANQQIFKRTAKLTCPGSTIVFDMVNANFMQSQRDGWHLRDLRQRGAPWKWGHNDPQSLLRPIGFGEVDVLDLEYLDVDRAARRLVRHRRPNHDRVEASREALTFYVTATRT